MQTGLNQQDQLAWQAYCYVADELSAEERDSFEAELAVNQTAREAVAQAVLMGQAVVAVSSDAAVPAADRAVALASPGNRRMLQGATWSCFGAAACLSIVFLTRSLWLPSPDLLARQSLPHDPAREQLALVWAQSTVGNDVRDLPAETSGDEGDDPTSTEEFSDDPAEVLVPDWLLEAVSANDDTCGPAPAEGG